MPDIFCKIRNIPNFTLKCVKNFLCIYEHFMAIKFQDKLDLSNLESAENVIVFLVPAENKICGGVMSIFSLCSTSREINSNAFCTLSTFPKGFTYVKNNKFPNEETILRFEQITEKAYNVQTLIIHVPEYYADKFYRNLSGKEIKFLKSVKNLQINILNQNIEIMPPPENLKNLYNLTNNITQTIAHNAYATQEVCDKWQIPTHLFSVHIDMSRYKRYEFEEKEKIIVLSPDKNDYKVKIINKLEKAFPDWKLITVKNMTFPQYMDLIGRAFFTISFGEGFDGYFLQPSIVNSIGLAVYNNPFFPDISWLDLPNVFKSYEDMDNNIINTMKHLYSNKEEYCKLSNLNKSKHDEIYNFEQYKNNLKRFYEKKYDFSPKVGALR